MRRTQAMEDMDDRRLRLQRRFARQQQFCVSCAPLYSRLFGLMAQWLSSPPGAEPAADWLLVAAGARASFEVPLLLLAGLHRELLCSSDGCAGDGPEGTGLAAWYPGLGGTRSPEDRELEDFFRLSILERQQSLADFIASATVQTNEPARGLCWLWPALCTGWPSFHLVELGAAAGLNLAADAHCYCLHGEQAQESLCRIGRGEHGCFLVTCAGETPRLAPVAVMPQVLSRTGCDLAPRHLRSREDEQTQTAFVWGDQVERLRGLRHGIAALRALEAEGAPVRLAQAKLPDDLEPFLSEYLRTSDNAPVVLFNTYLSTYLSDKGASLRSRLARWAVGRGHPLLWLQWETDWEAKGRGINPPEFGQLAWTADLWQGKRHYHWRLAWTHPHGARLHWLPGAQAWLDFFV